MRIVVGEGSCGIAAGARKVRAALEALVPTGGMNGQDARSSSVGVTGCIGMCYLEPIVDLYDESDARLGQRTSTSVAVLGATRPTMRLVRVQEKDAERIHAAAVSGDLAGVKDLEISEEDKQFLAKQTRIALRHCGVIDPESLDSYRATDGYKAIAKILGKGGDAPMRP